MDEMKERLLKQKLVDLVNYHTELKAQKKASNAAFAESIKCAVKKIEAIGESIDSKDMTLLQGAFIPEELYFLGNT